MFNTLRNNSKVIIYIVVAAFIITGGLMGYGAYISNNTSSAQVSSQFIAQVNDTKISQQDFLSVLRNQASQSSQLNDSQVIPFRLNVLNSMIERELILQQADKMDIKPDVTDKDVDDVINNILKNNKLEMKDLKSRLQEQGTTLAKFKDSIRGSLKTNSIIQQTIKTSYNKIKVTDQEVKAEYDKNQKQNKDQKFADVKDDLKNKLLQDKQQKAFNNWLENLKAESNIKIFDPSLSGLKELRAKKYDAAIKDLSKALESNQMPGLYMYLAEAYNGNKNTDKAVETYNKAIEEYPDNTQLRLSFGQLYSKLDKKDKAIEQYDKVSKLAGDDFMTHYQLYMDYKALKAEDKAKNEMNIIQEIQQKLANQNKQNQSNTKTDSSSNQTKKNTKNNNNNPENLTTDQAKTNSGK